MKQGVGSLNKYIRNMIAIALIVAIILLLFSFWINVDFGVWHMLLIITAIAVSKWNLSAQMNSFKQCCCSGISMSNLHQHTSVGAEGPLKYWNNC